jgi:hypothetical protein
MQTKKSSRNRPPKRTGKRILKFVLVFIVILILFVVFLVPVFISSAKGLNLILAKINNSIDGKTDFASLSMGWLKGVRITDFSFNDSRGRTSVKVKQIATKPQYGSILSGNISLGETIIDEPKVVINLKAQQPKETEKPKQETTTGKQSAPIALPIKKIDLVVKDGNLKVTDPKAQTVELSQIDSRVNLLPPGQETTFSLHTFVVNTGKKSEIHGKGRITPGKSKTGWKLKDTSGTFSVQVTDLNLPSLAPFLALAGADIQADGVLSGSVSGNIKDGKLENLNTDIKAKNLDITAPQLKGDRLKTSTLEVNAKLAREQKMVSIENLDIKADWLKANATGMVPPIFDSFTRFLESDFRLFILSSSLSGSFELDAAQVLSQMPQTFGVKEDMKVTSGKLSGTVSTTAKDGKTKIAGKASLERLEGTVDGKNVALQQPIKAEAEITNEPPKIIVDKAFVTASFGKFDCSGTSDSLLYTADIDLSALKTQLGQFFDMGKYQLAGQIAEKGTISAKDNQITAVGSSTIKNLSITSKDGANISEPQADIEFAVGYDRKNHIINIDSLYTSASFGQVDINDAVILIDTKGEKGVDLTVSAKIDLEKAMPFAVMFASFPKEKQLGGTAESQLSISSKNNTYRIITDDTKIKDFKFTTGQQEPFKQKEVTLAVNAEFNPVESTYGVKKFELLSDQLKASFPSISLATENGQSKLQGQAYLEYDWSAVSSLVAPCLPQDLSLEGQRKDTISFDSEYPAGQTDKLLENLNAKAKTGFEKAQYMGLNFGATDVDIQVQSGLLKIAPFSTTVNNGQFRFASETNLKEKPAIMKTTNPIQMAEDIQVSDELAGRLLKYVNPIFADTVNVSGLTNFHCERLAIPLKKVNKNEIEVIGTISVNQLRMEGSDLLGQLLLLWGSKVPGQDFTLNPTRFVLQNGFLHYEDMQLDVGDNPVNFKGTTGLDTSLNMTATLPYTMSGRTARVGEKTRDRISLPLRGTIDNPEIDVGKLLEEQAIKKGLELLEDLLK